MDSCARWSTNVYLYNKFGERQQYTVSVRPITGNIENSNDVTYFFISLIMVKSDPNSRNRIVQKKGYQKAKDKILRKGNGQEEQNAARTDSTHRVHWGREKGNNQII